jgi:hypothetical protein
MLVSSFVFKNGIMVMIMIKTIIITIIIIIKV